MCCCYPEDQLSLWLFRVAKRKSHFSDMLPPILTAEFSALFYLPPCPVTPPPLLCPKEGLASWRCCWERIFIQAACASPRILPRWITTCEFCVGWKWKSKPHSLSPHSRKKTHPDSYKLLWRGYFTFLEVNLMLPLTQCYWSWQLYFPVCLFHIF